MCGRYAASADPDQLVEEFEVEDDETGGLEPDWNVAPTKAAPVVVQRVRREDRRAAEDDGRRRRSRCASCARWCGGWCRPGPRTAPAGRG